VTFDDALIKRVNEEMSRLSDHVLLGNMELRHYDRAIGGIHALRLVIEEFIPEVRKILNER
jgi:hypothetical protein